MRFDELSQDNFILFAIKYYENPSSSSKEEFEEDLNRFKYVKRWLKKYHETGEANIHLLLNHLIIIFNCWGDASVPMLIHKISPDHIKYLKSFLVYLNRLPEYPKTQLHDIPVDLFILKHLNGL